MGNAVNTSSNSSMSAESSNLTAMAANSVDCRLGNYFTKTITGATTFTFDSPVFLNNMTEYCFVLMPEGNNPNYYAYVAKTGGSDIATSQAVHTDQLIGSLFLSTNNTARLLAYFSPSFFSLEDSIFITSANL